MTLKCAPWGDEKLWSNHGSCLFLAVVRPLMACRVNYARALLTRMACLSLLSALWTGGCNSLLFVDAPPPDYERRRTFACTKSYFWPVADTVLSASMVTTSGLVAAQENAGTLQGRAGIATLLGIATVAAVSAAFGYKDVGYCREAQQRAADYERWVRTIRGRPSAAVLNGDGPGRTKE